MTPLQLVVLAAVLAIALAALGYLGHAARVRNYIQGRGRFAGREPSPRALEIYLRGARLGPWVVAGAVSMVSLWLAWPSPWLFVLAFLTGGVALTWIPGLLGGARAVRRYAPAELLASPLEPPGAAMRRWSNAGWIVVGALLVEAALVAAAARPAAGLAGAALAAAAANGVAAWWSRRAAAQAFKTET